MAVSKRKVVRSPRLNVIVKSKFLNVYLCKHVHKHVKSFGEGFSYSKFNYCWSCFRGK